MEQKLSIGRIVLFKGPEANSNCATEASAIVTAAHSDTCANLTVFPDNASPVAVTSVIREDAGGMGRSWRWPPKV